MERPSRVRDGIVKAVATMSAAAALAVLLAASPAAASLSVEPALIHMDLDKGRPADVVTVTNMTDQEVRYRVLAVHFVYTRTGELQMVEPNEQSLALWLKFNPKEFTLTPKESRTIRLTVVAPSDLKDGEYWAALRFEPLKGYVSRGDDGEGRSVAIEVRANILVPIIGQVGEPSFVCDLKGLRAWRKDEGIAISAELVNSGNTRVRVKGSYEILDSSGTAVADGLIGEDTIMSGSERVFARVVEGNFPEEAYNVRVRYASDNLEEDLAGQTSVRDEAPAEPQSAP